MATLEGWVARTRTHLLTGRQEERNVLAADYTAGSGTIQVAGALGGIVPRVRLAIGLNTFYVLSVDNSNLTATVIAAQEGSLDADYPAGSTVWVGPKFTDYDILIELAAELNDLSAPGNGLFQMLTADLTYDNGAVGYDLGSLPGLIDIYEVRAQESGTYKGWSQVEKSLYRLDRSADTTVFPSGTALMLNSGLWNGLTVQVLYRAEFTALNNLTDDVLDSGLPATAVDIPPLGAAMRLVAPREIKRSFSEDQGDTRRASEIPPGSATNSMRGIASLRAQRIQAEAGRLTARWPDRRF